MKKQCTKIKYSSESVAVFEILKIRRKSKTGKVPIRAYLCPHCLSWHLTSEEHIETVLLRKKISELNNSILDSTIAISKKNEIILKITQENDIIKQKLKEKINHIFSLERRIMELKADIKSRAERYKQSF